MFLARFFQPKTTSPVYRALPWLVFAYVAACFVLHPFSPLRTGTFTDPDDVMRLNEVVAWLKGQGWYDLSVPRLSPGAGTVVHWARLVDLPIALAALPFVKFLGVENAVQAASYIVPMAMLGLALWLVPALAKPFTGARANLAAVLLLFAPMTLCNFFPTRVDHHNWQVLIAGFGILALEHILTDKNGWRWAIAAGIAFACGLWIGTEALPWLILFTACLAALSAWQGGILARNAAVFGLSLAAATAAVLPLAVPPAEYSSRALSWFSMGDVIFSALVAGLFMGGWLVERQFVQRRSRIILMALLGIGIAAWFVIFVPDVLHGPFADYDDFDSTTALANINEAQPLIGKLHLSIHNSLTWAPVFVNFMYGAFLPLLALGFMIYKIKGATPRARPLFIVYGIFVFAAFLLTLFWQVRVAWFLQLFILAPLTGLLSDGWNKIGRIWKGRPRFWAEIALLCLLGPLPIVLLPGAVHDAKFASDILLFPAARGPKTCDVKPAAAFLSQPWSYGTHAHTILSGSNEGPELLFRTPHSVIAANFNVAGNRDVYDFFNAHDDGTARAILKKWHADLVLTCKHVAPFYQGMDKGHWFLKMGNDGKLHLTADPKHPALVERLVNGTPPVWLKPVEIPGDSDYLLFEIRNHNRS